MNRIKFYRTIACMAASTFAAMLTGLLHAQTNPNLEIWFHSNRSGNWQIWKMNADGSGLQQVTTNLAATTAPVPSHDGTRIAYNIQDAGGYDLRIMNADGSNDTLVKAGLDQYSGVLSWLPDDSQFVVEVGGYAYVYTLNGVEQTTFIGPAQTGRSGVIYGMNFSSDGKRVAWSQCQYNSSLPEDTFVANYTNGAVDFSSSQQLDSNGGYHESPCFSPDGSLIAEWEAPAAGAWEGPAGLFVYGSSGNTNITPSLVTAYPSDWTPGDKILFYAYPTPAQDYANIYTINADGSGLTQLTSGHYGDYHPRWRVVPTAPSIQVQPVSQIVGAVSSVTFSVQASGQPTPSYQWQFGGTNISGATNASYTISSTSITNIGLYDVVVANSGGSIVSSNASLSFLNIRCFPGLILFGPVGANYNIQAGATLNGGTNWNTVANVSLTAAQPYIYIDYSSLTNSQQFYRAVPQ